MYTILFVNILEEHMKKIFSRIVLALCLSLLCTLLALSASARDTEVTFLAPIGLDETPAAADGELFEETQNRFGRQSLAKTDNAEAKLYVYDKLVSGFENLDSEIWLSDAKSLFVTVDEFKLVLDVYLSDYPENFWFNGSYKLATYAANGAAAVMYPTIGLYGETLSKQQIISEQKKFDRETAKIIERMNKKVEVSDSLYETQYSKALWLHDTVAKIVKYEMGPNHQTAYGALIDRRAICAGYCELYQVLLRKAGIESWAVKGTGINPVTGAVEAHEWTLMWLDGNCVYTDVTWDDQRTEIYHIYFARDLKTIEKDHVAFEGFFADSLPKEACDKCGTSGYFDHVMSGNKLSEDKFCGEAVSGLLEEAADGKIWKAVLFEDYDTGLVQWLLNNFSAIVRAGVESGKIDACKSYSASFGYEGSQLAGREVHLTIINADDTFVKAKQSDEGTCDVSVIKNAADGNKQACLMITYYDENNKTVGVTIKQVTNTFAEFSEDMPYGAVGFKTMVIDGEKLSPLCDFSRG